MRARAEDTTSRSVSQKSMSLRLLALVLPALFALGCSRGGSQASAASAPAPQVPAVEFVGQWGVHGSDPGQLDDPIGPAMDDIERVYLADRGTGSIEKFEAGGLPLLSFDDDQARGATAIAVDRGGGIYVADAHAGLLQIFFPEGDFIRGFHITPQRNWQGPFGFSINDGGKLLLPDPSGSRIEILDSHGKLEGTRKFPASATGQPGHPSIAMSGEDGSIYAGEWETGRIVKYSSDGRQVTDWGPAVGSSAPLLSLGVSSKYVFALRDAVPHLQIWTLDGHLKTTDNLGGLLDGTSPSKASLAVGFQSDLVVLDPAAPRVLRFRTHLDSP